LNRHPNFLGQEIYTSFVYPKINELPDIRTHLKNTFGLHTADFCSAAFSGLIVPLVRIVPAAAASLRNPLVFAFKAIFEMGSSHHFYRTWKWSSSGYDTGDLPHERWKADAINP